MNDPCPHCHTALRQAKWGRTRCGSQKYHCPACGRAYVADPKRPGYPPSVRQQAVRMSLDGINQRRVGRLLSVNHQSIANWLREYHERLGAQHPDPSQPPQTGTVGSEAVQMDKFYTFVGFKKAAPTSARR